MNNTAGSQSIQWRPLSDAEYSASAEARLGGALGVIFWSAVAMVAVAILVVAGLIAFGGFSSAMVSRMLFSESSIASIITGISMIPQVMFVTWAFVFAVMTMGRRPSTPRVASVMMVIWALTSIGAQIATRHVIAQDSFVLGSQATLLPHMLIEIVLVAAFYGYMSEGRRPNVYFLKRVRA